MRAHAPVPGSVPHGEFEEMYHGEFQYVWNSLRRLGIPDRDLPDVTHDVFVTVARRLPTFDRGRPLRPWIFGVLYRVAADHRRLGRNAREVLAPGAAAQVQDREPAADEQVWERQARELVRRALDEVDFDHRAVLVMHDFEEHQGRDIAEALAIPVKTVFSRLRNARRKFAEAVARLQAGTSREAEIR